MKNTTLLCFLLLLGPVAACPLAAQVTWYVDDDAPADPGPGDTGVSDPLEDGSAEHPFDAIQEGIDAAAGGDTVMVRDGSYSGAGNFLVDFSGKAVLLRSENGAESCEIDGDGPAPGGIVFENGEGPDSVLRGFTIRNVSSENFVVSSPVRIFGASPTIEDNIIRETINEADDQYGGAIFCLDSEATIRGNLIRDNRLFGGRGSGIYCVNADPEILFNTISHNHSVAGGAIYCENSSPTISGNVVEDNGCDYLGGAGLYLYGASYPVVSGNTISGNTIVEGGRGAGVYCLSGASPLIVGNVISRNNDGYNELLSPQVGGGICCESGSPVIAGNLITGNIAHCTPGLRGRRDWPDCYGAGIACVGSASPTIINNFISGNVLRGIGGFNGYGGGIHCGPDTSPLIRNCTVVDNRFDGPITAYGVGICCETPSAVIVDCIVRGNRQLDLFGCEGLVSYSNVEGWISGPGNFDADPLFVAGPDGCYALAHQATGQPDDSPCVDTGSGPAADVCFTGLEGMVCLDGLTTRIDGVGDEGTVDIGYHHGVGVTLPCPPTVDASFTCLPASGTLPFTSRMELILENRFSGQERTVAASIRMTLAGGGQYDNWRGGWAVLEPGGFFRTAWPQDIPLLTTVVGENRFELVTEDVTPAPFNQPPYPPAGDTATGGCSLTGVAP